MSHHEIKRYCYSAFDRFFLDRNDHKNYSKILQIHKISRVAKMIQRILSLIVRHRGEAVLRKHLRTFEKKHKKYHTENQV